MYIVVIKDLNFSYKNKQIFQKLNLTIKQGSFTTIIGPNGAGKSTLVKLLTGILKTYSYVNIDGKILCHDNIKEIRKIIGVVFENPDDQFVAETVMDDIAFSLENMKLPKKEIRKRIKNVANYLNIENILEREPHSLSGGEKQLVALASALVIEPKILILDEALTMIDPIVKNWILNLLKDLHNKTDITIINVTHDVEESLYGDDIVVIHNGKIVLNGTKKDVLKEEKMFTKLGLQLPFMADLSIKLSYYGLIDDLILDMDEMVDKLWK